MHNACKSWLHAKHTWSLKPNLLLRLAVHPWRSYMTVNHHASAISLTSLLCCNLLVFPRMTSWSSLKLAALMLTFLAATAQEDLKVKIVTKIICLLPFFFCFLCFLSAPWHHFSMFLFLQKLVGIEAESRLSGFSFVMVLSVSVSVFHFMIDVCFYFLLPFCSSCFSLIVIPFAWYMNLEITLPLNKKCNCASHCMIFQWIEMLYFALSPAAKVRGHLRIQTKSHIK